ncbi:MAG: PD-(D/E)XK nuclease family protein, partial [Endomicrobium sp.]|nr:PD-(D/E)XK nuclease family protein [Endomicrobium sp.]
NKFTLNVYSAYDDQSQAVLLKNLIKAVPEKEYDKTAVIVPKPEMIQSVVAEISAITGNYNVSAGYPASKTAVFSLVKSVMRAQLSRKGKSYYAKDVVSVLTNPLVKNMRFFADASVSRIIAHKIEKALDLSSKGSLSGKLFIDFEDILNHGELLKDAGGAVAGAWKHLPAGKLKGVLEDIFKTLFVDWEKPDTLNALSETVTGFLEKVSAMSVIQSYPLDREALEILISAARDLKCGKVANARFGFEEMLNIFEDVLKNKKIALPGSPLKGLQILGILESRNLSFDNVYIVAMNDSSFPAVTKEFPLVPKDIMFSLGIEMAKKEFEIQSYHFQRLIACSKNLSLIYSDNEKDERSRFAEDLIWQKQFLSKDINCAEAKKFVLSKPPAGGMKKNAYEKTGAVKAFLKNMTYSHTKIDAYLRCRLGFYFRYVLGLDENIEVGKEVSQSDMGTFIHKFLSGVFRENTAPEEIRTEKFKKYYLEKLLGDFDNSPDMKSREDAFLIKKVLEYRMERLLAYEKTRDYGIIFKCEEKYVSEIEAGSGKYKIECFIDRIDKSRGSYGIYDYKTGNAGDSIVSAKFDELISAGSRKNIKKAVKSLQLPLYKYIFENSGAFNVSQIALYDVKRAKIVEFPPDGKIYSGCIDAVKEILEEINSGESFEFDENDKENCLNCKYFYICR